MTVDAPFERSNGVSDAMLLVILPIFDVPCSAYGVWASTG